MKSRILALVLSLVWGAAATAQTEPADMGAQPAAGSQASEAADKFSLDLPAEDETAAVASDATPPPVPEEAPVADAKGRFTLDTPIAKLLANYRSKAVLDKRLPGLSVDKNLDKFSKLSLRKFAPLTGGKLTDELLEQTGKDLAAIE